ncbi:MAG: hypothetical protein AAF596_07110 [Planctomycetota bacterium]
MKIARYWVRAEAENNAENNAEKNDEELFAWGWSDSSEAEARGRAERSVARIAAWRAAGCETDAPDSWYGYDARPAREEIVEEFGTDGGGTTAVVTRNPYGVLVLNTRDLVFVDADIPHPPPSIGDLVPKFLRGLFGKPAAEAPPATPEEQTLDKIRTWSAENPQVGVRVYRTAAGFRLVVTSHAIEATAPEADGLLAALPTDTLYRQLCLSQECYRARLTPKPWRIGVPAPRQRYPWSSGEEEQAFRQWRSNYEKRAERFSTCRFVEWLGPNDVLPELEPLIELHDRLTRCDADAPLA